MNLYNIMENYLAVMREAEENEGLLSEEAVELLQITEENFKEKSEQFAKLIKEYESQITFAESELERINKYIATKTSLISKLKESLLPALQMFGNKDPKKDIWRYEIGTFKFNTAKSSKIEIDEFTIEDKWKQEVITTKFDYGSAAKIGDLLGINVEVKHEIPKTPIKDAIEKGEIIAGASIKETFRVNIK